MKILVFIILMTISGLISIAGIVLLGLRFEPEQANLAEKLLLFLSLFFALSSSLCLIIFALKKRFSKNKPIFQHASSAFLIGLILSGLVIGGLVVRKYIL